MEHADDFLKVCERGPGIYSCLAPLRVLGAAYGRRAVLVAVGERAFLFSPLGLPELIRDELSSIAPVAGIIIPIRFHDTGVRSVAASFPGVPIYAPASLADRIPDVRHQPVEALSAEGGDTLLAIPIRGAPKVEETVFYHPASESLIVCDLFFRFDRHYDLWTRLFARLAGVYPCFGVSRVMKSLIQDRTSLAASVRQIEALEIRQILPSHGLIIDSDAVPEALASLRAVVGRGAG